MGEQANLFDRVLVRPWACTLTLKVSSLLVAVLTKHYQRSSLHPHCCCNGKTAQKGQAAPGRQPILFFILGIVTGYRKLPSKLSLTGFPSRKSRNIIMTKEDGLFDRSKCLSTTFDE